MGMGDPREMAKYWTTHIRKRSNDTIDCTHK
jgi:hypothetical protein